MKGSIANYSEQMELLREKMKEVDAIIIGAGAGLSTAAGFVYDGDRYLKYFSDFEEKYHFKNMYSGGFHPYESLEEYWAYWSRYIYINRYKKPQYPVYEQLLELVKDKEYFVLTTNVDHQFQKAGFDKERLFYTQGDYGLLQCMEPCCNETFDNEELISKMVKQQDNMRIPTELIPYCPHCGKPLVTNLRADDTFVQDKGWNKAAKNYAMFEEQHKNSNILYWEIGVGFNTPGIIKYNFWQQVGRNRNAFYVCINKDYVGIPVEIQDRAISMNGDACDLISELLCKR